MFTGIHAEVLNDLGKKVGPAKHAGLVQHGTVKTFYAKSLATDYFEKMKTFIENPKIRIKESVNQNTRMYEGEDVELNIHAKSSGKMGKPGFKLDINDITWEPKKIS